MITTNDKHEVQPFPFMRTPGFKSWRTAGLDVWKSYFLMSYACKEGRTWVSQGMILWCQQDLLGFCEQARDNPSIRIHRITKLVPPQPGQVEIWNPVPIKEIWYCANDNREDDLLLIACEGSQLRDSKSINRKKNRRMKQIFSAAADSTKTLEQRLEDDCN
jgi:hypothetical protein